MTHHQGRGASPLRKATNGVSTRTSLGILHLAILTLIERTRGLFRPMRMSHELCHLPLLPGPLAVLDPYPTQQAIVVMSRVKAWATRLIPSLKVGNTWAVSIMSPMVSPNFTASVAS